MKTLGLKPRAAGTVVSTAAERSRERGRHDAEALADAAFLPTPWLVKAKVFPPRETGVAPNGEGAGETAAAEGAGAGAAGHGLGSW